MLFLKSVVLLDTQFDDISHVFYSRTVSLKRILIFCLSLLFINTFIVPNFNYYTHLKISNLAQISSLGCLASNSYRILKLIKHKKQKLVREGLEPTYIHLISIWARALTIKFGDKIMVFILVTPMLIKKERPKKIRRPFWLGFPLFLVLGSAIYASIGHKLIVNCEAQNVFSLDAILFQLTSAKSATDSGDYLIRPADDANSSILAPCWIAIVVLKHSRLRAICWPLLRIAIKACSCS